VVVLIIAIAEVNRMLFTLVGINDFQLLSGRVDLENWILVGLIVLTMNIEKMIKPTPHRSPPPIRFPHLLVVLLCIGTDATTIHNCSRDKVHLHHHLLLIRHKVAQISSTLGYWHLLCHR
jgi:hypothetical protein